MRREKWSSSIVCVFLSRDSHIALGVSLSYFFVLLNEHINFSCPTNLLTHQVEQRKAITIGPWDLEWDTLDTLTVSTLVLFFLSFFFPCRFKWNLVWENNNYIWISNCNNNEYDDAVNNESCLYLLIICLYINIYTCIIYAFTIHRCRCRYMSSVNYPWPINQDNKII